MRLVACLQRWRYFEFLFGTVHILVLIEVCFQSLVVSLTDLL